MEQLLSPMVTKYSFPPGKTDEEDQIQSILFLLRFSYTSPFPQDKGIPSILAVTILTTCFSAYSLFSLPDTTRKRSLSLEKKDTAALYVSFRKGLGLLKSVVDRTTSL